jgi:hypothetical protein
MMGGVDYCEKELYGLIADVNAQEIAEQIKADNLSAWCGSWRIAAKAALRAIANNAAAQRERGE